MKQTDEMVQKVVEQARKNLKSSDMLLPTFFVGTSDQMVIVGADWQDDQDKDLVAYKVKRLAHEMNAEFVVFVAESWTMDSGDAPDFMKNRDKYPDVHSYPKSYECVMFSIETATSIQMGRAKILEGRVMGDIEWMRSDGSEGRFTNFLGKKPTMN